MQRSKQLVTIVNFHREKRDTSFHFIEIIWTEREDEDDTYDTFNGTYTEEIMEIL